MPAATNPSPAPPADSGSQMPSNPAEASSPHNLASKRSSVSSISRRRSGVARSVKMRDASSLTASCSSVKEKSTSSLFLAKRPRHAEAEDGDQIALDLVGPAAEGEDDEPSGVGLEPSVQDLLGRAPTEG